MKILCYDHGLCTEAAIKLVNAGHSVAYFTPWQDTFPELNSVVGQDLDGLERVDPKSPGSYRRALERCDLFVCFDTYSEDRIQEALALGKPSWGARGAERLELDRPYMKAVQKKLGLPTQPYETVTGLTKLAEKLKQVKDKWVKSTGIHRGLIETFHHQEWSTTSAMELGQMMSDFGPYGESIDFLIEDPVGECEPGFDGLVVAGEYLSPHMIGYEDKDETYIGHVTTTFPTPLHSITKNLLPLLKSYGSSTFVSYEARIDKQQRGYLIDPCFRAPHPPMACELESFGNFADLITNGARGVPVPVKAVSRYSAAIEIKSDWVQTHWAELTFPEQNRQWVKLQKACMVGGKYWALPGSFVVATCVGLGETPEKAAQKAMKVASEFKAKGMYYDEASLDNLIKKTVPEGIKYGIPF